MDATRPEQWTVVEERAPDGTPGWSVLDEYRRDNPEDDEADE